MRTNLANPFEYSEKGKRRKNHKSGDLPCANTNLRREANMKKAIVVASFGTSYEETRKLTLDRIESKIREEFQGYEVVKAYTSHRIINKIKKRDGIVISTPAEAVKDLKDRGFEEVYVQPIHVISGEEYDYIKISLMHTFHADFKVLKVGRPLLYFKGEEEDTPDDFTMVFNAIEDTFKGKECVIMMGHGTMHPSTAAYSCLESVIHDNGYENVYMATVEGYPTLDRVIKRIKRKGIKNVMLMPFMIVAGDHAQNDMASDEEDSWKTILTEEGFNVEIYMHGLGENEKIRDIYVDRIKDTISGEFDTLGKTKKRG